MKRSGQLGVLAALMGIFSAQAGCLGSTDNDSELIGATSLPIIGGVEDSGDPAVVMTQTADGQCTGTLIAPTVVLTAAHCVKYSIDNGLKTGRAFFGPGGGTWTDTRNIVDLFMHRQYEGGLESGFDIALMRLSAPAPATIDPIPLNTTPLTEAYIGAEIRTVGFGANMSSPDGQTQSGYGTKRQLSHAILDITSDFIITGDRERNTCQGDSGGPTFMRIDGVEYVIAVTSFGAQGCGSGSNPESKQARVDIYLDDFVNEVVAAWSGPCQEGDFQCVTDGCGDFPDPDCDGVCGVDGSCSTGCAKKDLDCPYSGELGDLCTDREGCESLTCIVSEDDERVSYCSEPCDPGDPNACGSLSCTNRAEGDVCTYPGLTPSTQGAPCSDGSDCRSGVCDDVHNICIEQCGDGFPECTDGFSCISIGGGARACTLPRDDGGCSAGGTGAGAALLLMLAGALLWSNKRRKTLFKAS